MTHCADYKGLQYILASEPYPEDCCSDKQFTVDSDFDILYSKTENGEMYNMKRDPNNN